MEKNTVCISVEEYERLKGDEKSEHMSIGIYNIYTKKELIDKINELGEEVGRKNFEIYLLEKDVRSFREERDKYQQETIMVKEMSILQFLKWRKS